MILASRSIVTRLMPIQTIASSCPVGKQNEVIEYLLLRAVHRLD